MTARISCGLRCGARAGLAFVSLLLLASAAQASEAEGAASPLAGMSGPAWMFHALGVRYTLAFLALGGALVAALGMNLVCLKRRRICPEGLIEAFESCVRERRWDEAYATAAADDSALGRMLAAGMRKLSDGEAPTLAAAAAAGNDEWLRCEHRLSHVALIGTLAPLVGLLGTVDGMIGSFTLIASRSVTPKPWELAGGISTALFTTLVGLVIAIPAIVAFGLLKNRIARLLRETGVVSEALLSPLARRKPAAS